MVFTVMKRFSQQVQLGKAETSINKSITLSQNSENVSK